MIATRRAVLAGAGAGLIAGPLSAQERNALPLALNGAWRQGGYALGRTAPGALVFVDGEALTTASAAGLFVIGFDRDAGPGARIEVRSADGARSAIVASSASRPTHSRTVSRAAGDALRSSSSLATPASSRRPSIQAERRSCNAALPRSASRSARRPSSSA